MLSSARRIMFVQAMGTSTSILTAVCVDTAVVFFANDVERTLRGPESVEAENCGDFHEASHEAQKSLERAPAFRQRSTG